MQADDDRLRRARLLLVTSLFPIPPAIGFAIAYAAKIPESLRMVLVLPILGCIPVFLAVAPVLRWTGSLVPPLRLLLGTSLALMSFLALFSGGSTSHGLYWICLLPTAALLIGGPREAMLWWAASSLVYVAFGVADYRGTFVGSAFLTTASVAFAECTTIMAIGLACFAFFERTQRQAEASIRSRHAELAAARVAAQASSDAKTVFLSRMSHRIRTPLMSILGYTELLLSKLQASEDLDSLSRMQRNGEHLLHIVDDMLDLSRIESGELEVHCESIDVADLVREVLVLLEPRASSKQLRLTFEAEAGQPSCVRGDPIRLKQVLVNLIGNAIKFTPEGSISVSLSGVPNTSKYVRISVRDTGIGIDDAVREQLFRPFQQASSSTSRSYGGTGLGLAISRQLITAMQGTISLESVLGQGTRIDVDLLVASSADQASRDVEVGYTPDQTWLFDVRILIADDSDDTRRLLRTQLERVGARTEEASNGESALALVDRAAARGEPFDLLLMDLQMPGVDGFEATQRLRDQGFASPIVALTADAMLQTKERCIRLGFDGFATKPLTFECLLELIEYYLRPRTSNPEAETVLGATAHHAGEPASPNAAALAWGEATSGPRAAESPACGESSVHSAPSSTIRERCRSIAEYFVPESAATHPEKMARAQMLTGFAFASVLLMPVHLLLVHMVFEPAAARPVMAAVIVLIPLCTGLPFIMKRTGQVQLLAHLVLGSGALLIAGVSAISGGIQSVFAPWFVVLPVTGLAVFGFRACAAWFGLSCLLLAGLALAAEWGLELPHRVLPGQQSLAFTLACGLITTWLWLLAGVCEEVRLGVLARLRVANLELSAARDRARAADHSKGRFLATLSHEIRTPMTAILGFADVLGESWRGREVAAECREYLRLVDRNATSLLDLINDLLDLAKLDAGQLQSEPCVFDPAQLLDDVVAEARRRGCSDATLEWEIDARVAGRVVSDELRIRQVLRHMVDNAMRWSGARRVLVRLEPSSQESLEPVRAAATVTSMPNHAMLCWVVEDDGSGLDARGREALTSEPASEPASEAPENTGRAGLGGPICRRLCAAANGTFSVEPRASGGTRAVISLPGYAEADSRGSVVSAAPDGSSGVSPAMRRGSAARFDLERTDDPVGIAGARVLLVEDSPDNQRLLAHVLTGAGAELAVASNGSDGVERVLEARGMGAAFDVILMDLEMPILDGFAALERLRSGEVETPIIALTAKTMTEARAECLRHGFDEVLTKPIERRELIRRIAQQLHAHQKPRSDA